MGSLGVDSGKFSPSVSLEEDAEVYSDANPKWLSQRNVVWGGGTEEALR